MNAPSEISPARQRWHTAFQGLQKMGRSLQLPIAVLPAAGILNRLGQPDVFGDDGLGWDNVAKVTNGAGGALLDGSLGLPLLYRIVEPEARWWVAILVGVLASTAVHLLFGVLLGTPLPRGVFGF